MAEVAVVASAAGLVSLGLQLTESAQKLKHFYSFAKAAPENLNNLIFETETLLLLLGQIDSHRYDLSETEGVALMRYVSTCEQAATTLNDMVTKLSTATQRFRIRGSLYAAFKEQDLKTCRQELDRARASLSFAYQLYEGYPICNIS